MSGKWDIKNFNPKNYSHQRDYNPSDLIHISPTEIERQHKLNMEQMKNYTDKWTLENQRVNREIDRQVVDKLPTNYYNVV